MLSSTFWKILAVIFGLVFVVDCVGMIVYHVDTALVLANGAWTVICTIQVERALEREARANEAANRDQTTQG